MTLPRRDWILIAVGAVLLNLAYPPFHLLLPSFVCLVPIVLLLEGSQERPRPLLQNAVQGFWFGLIANAGLLYWIAVAIWRRHPAWIGAYPLVVTLMAVYMAALFAVIGWMRRRTGFSLVLIVPACWTACEWIVAHQGTWQFPWLGLGTSLTGFPVMVQFADIIGARGLTLFLVAANVTVAVAWTHRANLRFVLSRLGLVAGGIALAVSYGVFRMQTLPVTDAGRVALLQPGIGYQREWQPQAADSIFSRLLDLSRQATAGGPGLIVWPETAVPGFFAYRPAWKDSLDAEARRTGTRLLVGAPELRAMPTGGFQALNAAIVFDPGESRSPSYHKRYRLPLVENGWLPRAREVERGPSATLYSSPLGAFGIVICYESAFEDLARDYRVRGADFMVNISNDDWFLGTTQPYQHAAHLVMRAIENRMAIARAANSGITGLIDPLGRLHDLLPVGDRGIATGALRTTTRDAIYTQLGDWVGLLSLVGTTLLGGWAVLAAGRSDGRTVGAGEETWSRCIPTRA